MELKQQRRRRLLKRHLKSKFAKIQTLSRLFHLVEFKIWHIFQDLNSYRLFKIQEKKKKVVLLCSRSPTNVKLGTFTSLSCSDGKEMYKKGVKARAKFCFVY